MLVHQTRGLLERGQQPRRAFREMPIRSQAFEDGLLLGDKRLAENDAASRLL